MTLSKKSNLKQNINKKWIVVTLNGKRLCWGNSKYILSHWIGKPEIQFQKGLKIELMNKKEVFDIRGKM